MIDVHLHLLPGVDDGPTNLAGALALARECAATDTPAVIATPHYDDSTRTVLADAATATAHVDRLQAELDRAGIPVQVLTGCEAFLTPDLPRRVRDGLVPTMAGTRWLLVETTVQQQPLNLEQTLFELQAMGIVPLLAHPERYAWLRRDPDILASLVVRGVRAQVTAASLTGRRGSEQRRFAETLVQRNLVQVMASDRHRAGTRASLHEGYTAAVALVGEERAHRLIEVHPRRIVEDKLIDADVVDESRRETWLSRWFRR
jgi:protein-tyrosine phosphatase